MLGRSLEGGTTSRRHEAQTLIVAELKTSGTVSQSSGPMPIAQTDEVANGPESASAGDKISSVESVDGSTELPPILARKPSEEMSVLPVLTPLETRYFQPDELTEKPRLLQDIPLDKVTVLPDISPQPASVQLLINEQGDIDRVIIEDSLLSEQAKQFVIHSFENVKFHPGKLGDMPVRSQLRIEVTLKSTAAVAATTAH